MKKILFLISFLFLVSAIFLAWFVPSAYIGSASSLPMPVNIPDGTTAKQVGELLEQKGIIASSFGYRIFSYFDAAARNPRAGDYAVVPGSSYRVLTRQFSLGPARDEITVRILEGYTLRDVGAKLNEWGVKTIAWNDLVGSAEQGKKFSPVLREQFDFLRDLPENATLEGYLFPDTYRVWKDQLPLGFVLKQLQEFSKQTDGFVIESVKQSRSLSEVVILASIVEKEGRTFEEKKMIAGIFLNRLKIGMRLQSDATVNYLTNAGRARPTLDDLEVDSTYNTYKHAGLPPGPICNPGKDSLEAALHPTANDYYYYLHDEAGKIYYARNIEEHKVNRYKAYGE